MKYFGVLMRIEDFGLDNLKFWRYMYVHTFV